VQPNTKARHAGNFDSAALNTKGLRHERFDLPWRYHAGPGAPRRPVACLIATIVASTVLVRFAGITGRRGAAKKWRTVKHGWTSKLAGDWDRVSVGGQVRLSIDR
jgi:hypothetical protein